MYIILALIIHTANIFESLWKDRLVFHPLMKVKEESEKAGLKFNIQKIKTMASNPITSWQIDGKQWEQ